MSTKSLSFEDFVGPVQREKLKSIRKRFQWGIIGRSKPRTTIGNLNHDVLLHIFDWYRLDNTMDDFDRSWNLERWWYKLIQVCHVWRHIILASPTCLNLHLVCTYGTPVEAMLTHSPPFPLIIYYPAKLGEMAPEDKKGAVFALLKCERVRRVHLEVSTASLHDLVRVMDNDYPMLQRLVIRSQTENRARTGTVTLPKKLRAPLLHRLTLSNIALPINSVLLSSADGLVALGLHNFPACADFHPEHFVAQLAAMSHLRMVTIHFNLPIPNREIERRLLRAGVTRVTLPSLRLLAFRGSSTYLEGILKRLNAPYLQTLNVEFFNQLTFNLPFLLQLSHTMDDLKLHAAEVHFDKDFVSLIVDPHDKSGGAYPFHLQVGCKPLDWQASCAAQICSTLAPLLARTESLRLGFHKDGLPAAWQADVDRAQWHTLLRTFGGVKTLQLAGGLVGDLFRSLQLPDGGLPQELLPGLQELVPRGWGHTDDAFSSFVTARGAAGRPIRLVRN
ncbi:hypothetical protein BJV78DRAFT_1242935 [Lactifluus subvellereus]|nr:hypothetical protein BJV78DRAFT_1242935 [Lactifluus subvellereus]